MIIMQHHEKCRLGLICMVFTKVDISLRYVACLGSNLGGMLLSES